MNRAMSIAVDDLKEYLEYYYAFVEPADNYQDYFSLLNPSELQTLIPDIRFVSETSYPAHYNQLNDEGKFYKYSAPSKEFADNPDYNGYIYIPNKYDDILDIINVFHNIYNSTGVIARFPSEFMLSEVVYNKFVRENYLELPPDFPEEVKNLALEITQGLTTDYEKALAIEKYIARNYTYTLNPHPPYDSKADFVYNFLFDQQEGYCTAYASAMITMLRYLGVPARYAEGYVVDTSKRQRGEDGRDYITVHDYDGHAWPEVYLRGIGWIPFEPTVSYNPDDEKEQQPYIYNPPIRTPQYEMSMMTTEPYEEDEDDETNGGQSANTPVSKSFYVLIAIVCLIVGIFMLNRIIISNRFKTFKTANTNTAVLKMLSYILIFMKHCGYVMHNEEGLKQFAKRVSPNFETIEPTGWEKIAEIMQKARYSRHEITEEERIAVYEFIETLRDECLKKLNFNLKFRLQFVYFML
jgi:transglutaminase-like putative cysteine protease